MVTFLLSANKKAAEIRKNYIIYVVPMLNPDGVIQGNHRTCLAGFDMNRRWSTPSPWIHPVIFATKNLASLAKEERTIDVYCDIHGHF
jgi:murein tripeptide amidase MpaA